MNRLARKGIGIGATAGIALGLLVGCSSSAIRPRDGGADMGAAGRDGGTGGSSGTGGAGGVATGTGGSGGPGSGGSGGPGSGGSGGPGSGGSAGPGSGGRGSGGSGSDGSGGTGSSNGGLGGAGGSPLIFCDGCTLTRLDIAGERLVHDNKRGRLYISVAGAAPEYPNTLVTVDPVTSQVLSAPHAGSNPRVLALSDDASTLWMGLDGTLSIRKVDLTTATPTLGTMYALPQEGFQSYRTATRMVVLPGAPASVAVDLGGFNGVFIFDDGVARATNTRISSVTSTELLAGPPGFLFGYDGGSTAFSFNTYTVSASGVTVKAFPGLLTDFLVQLVRVGTRIYSSNGYTVDVTNPAAPVAGPRFTPIGSIVAGAPGRILMLTSPAATTATGMRIVVLDAATMTEMTSLRLPVSVFPSLSKAGITYFAYAGGDAVAFLSYGGEDPLNSPTARIRLYILRSPVLDQP